MTCPGCNSVDEMREGRGETHWCRYCGTLVEVSQGTFVNTPAMLDHIRAVQTIVDRKDD